MPRTTTRVFAAFAVAGLTSLAVGAPALAAPPSPGCKPVAGKPAYPPGQCKKAAVTGDTSPGGRAVGYSGEGQFDKGSTTSTELHSTVVAMGNLRVDLSGAATLRFTVPASFAPGAHSVVFKGTFFGQPRTVTVPFIVPVSGGTTSAVSGGTTSAGAGGSASGGSGVSGGTTSAGSGLPLTGFELGAASLLGVGLLGAGTVAVLSGRKKKGLATA